MQILCSHLAQALKPLCLGSFSPFMAMAEFQVGYKLCLNGHPVPVETKEMVLVDPLNLAMSHSLNLPESSEVNLISFKASGDMNWLCKSLKVPGGDGPGLLPHSPA